MGEKPWYKSLKKWLGIIFALAVLIGGIIDIVRNPDNVVRILELWGLMSFSLLGVTSAVKLGHKAIDKNKDNPE